ncbi:DUF2442 domain-containing protein [Sphaerotilus microaerophilus]|uniref:DUF2442 domain-containing protein n=1 Tax=Sphaerotilus microaerophilus TaxID=2914710 RepID=A0ABN6PN82_9BURK|nr:DUF2442 domain-containing protein [Sphaerotilus sp. FB-5]BDI05305.1 hypothetical protein CATMQ487_22750 [Sphaerotilus sp. FB-5]
MLLDLKTVVPQPDFQLDLEFENGERRRFDMRPLLAMKPWNRIATPAVFARVRVEYGTAVWPGEIDIAPETLYDDSVPLQADQLQGVAE